MMTAICARLAASATREKSLRRASVEGGACWTGRGAPKPLVVVVDEVVVVEGCGHCEAVL